MKLSEVIVNINWTNHALNESEAEFKKASYKSEIEKTKLIYLINSKLTENDKALEMLTACSGFFNETTLVFNIVPMFEGKIVTDFNIVYDLIEKEAKVIDSQYLSQGLLQEVHETDSEIYNDVLEIKTIIEESINLND